MRVRAGTLLLLQVAGALLAAGCLRWLCLHGSVQGLLSIKPPEHPEAIRWLRHFHQQQLLHQQHRPFASRAQQQAGAPPAAVEGPAACGVPHYQQDGLRRTNLVVAAVGDGWDAARWLSQPSSAAFDVVALYYGSDPSFSCPLCSDVLRIHGPKWYVIYNATTTPEWQGILARGYEYLLFPDDDLHMDTCQLNQLFSVAKEFAVVLAQPAVCRGEGSYTCWEELYQRPDLRLHFTSFVEIMAPAVRADFFQAVVRHTLNGTFTGYGLDFVWPALLGWPRDKVAVVDEVCMVHPPSPPGGKPGGLYHVTGKFTKESGYEEQRRTNRRYNLWQPVVWRKGMLWKTPKVFGSVPRRQQQQQQRGSGAAEGGGSSWQHAGFAWWQYMSVLLLLAAVALCILGRRTLRRSWALLHKRC